MGGEACNNPEGKNSGRKGIKAQQLFEDTNDGVDDDEEPVEVIEEEGSGSKFWTLLHPASPRPTELDDTPVKEEPPNKDAENIWKCHQDPSWVQTRVNWGLLHLKVQKKLWDQAIIPRDG